jgi:hypothetical protein
MMPVPPVASETRGVEAKHGADLPGAQAGDELLEAWARRGSASGSAEIVIDDLDIAETPAAGFVNKVVLTALALEIDLQLCCVD